MEAIAWDQFIASTNPSAFFQSWKWGEVEQKLGHKIWRMQWHNGIALVVKVEAKRGTFLHVRHGPVIKHTTTLQTFLPDLVKLAKKENAWFIRISPQIADSVQNQTLLRTLGMKPAAIHAMDAEHCWVLDLTSSEEELLLHMRKSTRYEIKHSRGITVEKSTNLKRFFKLYKTTSERHNFVKHTGIAEEFETFDAHLYIASYQGVDLASAIITYFGNEAIHRHGASVKSKIPASVAIQWEAIREAKKRGKKVYNFWGIAPNNKPNHPWRGITLFKMGFGGREINNIHAHDLAISPFYIIPKTIEVARRVLRGY